LRRGTSLRETPFLWQLDRAHAELFKFSLRFPASQIGECAMKNGTLKVFLPLIGAVMLMTIIACGRQDSPAGPTQGSPTSTGPTSPDLPNKTVPAAHDGVAGVYKMDITITRSGTATMTLTWPDADFSLQLYLTGDACADTTSLLTGACRILGASRVGNPPVTVTIPVNNGDTNTVWVVNRDHLPQSFTVDIQIE
jgi:hypothetical protein